MATDSKTPQTADPGRFRSEVRNGALRRPGRISPGLLSESSERVPQSSENIPVPDDSRQFAGPAELISDVEEATQKLSKAGIDVRFERLGDPSAFFVEFKTFPFGVTTFMVTKLGTDFWGKLELPGRMAVVVNPGGTTPSVFTISGHNVPASTGRTAAVLQSGREIGVVASANAPLFVLTAQLRDLERRFRDIVGTGRVSLDFEPALNLKSIEGRRFQRMVDFTSGTLKADPSIVQHPILRRQFDDLILGGLLSLPGKHDRLIDLASRSTGSAIVRRAEEFMEANVGRPIGMSDVAAECGCSRTALYQAFKREGKWTPLQFLVRRRMEHARRRLLAPSEGMNVSMVSLDCGYYNFSRFSEVYRKIFGEPPSKTLHRNR